MSDQRRIDPGETAAFIAAAASRSSSHTSRSARQSELSALPAMPARDAPRYSDASSHGSHRAVHKDPSNAPVHFASAVPPVPPEIGKRSRGHAGSPYSKEFQKGPRKGGARNVISTLLIVLGVALLVTAAGLFIHAQLGYQEAKKSYDNVAAKYTTVSDAAGDAVPAVDFDALAQVNPDIVGWVYVPGTVINYPVVQTKDNTKYLRVMFDGTNNGNGAIFMDMDDTAPGMIDQQTTIYGHHMYDKTMFNIIDKTTNQATFDTIGKVYYITRTATYQFTPMFTAQVEDTYGDARVPNFGDEAGFQAYLGDMLKQAKAKASDAEQRVASTKQVITLVTCAGEIIPRTTRAAMVCSLDQVTQRDASTNTTAGTGDAAAANSANGSAQQ